jgi:hypothetical protein
MSAASAELAVAANTAAASTSFFMTIPISFVNSRASLPQGIGSRLRPNLAANLVWAMQPVKQKTQATADFLGV